MGIIAILKKIIIGLKIVRQQKIFIKKNKNLKIFQKKKVLITGHTGFKDLGFQFY